MEFIANNRWITTLIVLLVLLNASLVYRVKQIQKDTIRFTKVELCREIGMKYKGTAFNEKKKSVVIHCKK